LPTERADIVLTGPIEGGANDGVIDTLAYGAPARAAPNWTIPLTI
jgi:hypothetical protein